MSRSHYERGEFIRAKMSLYILHDLGDEKINAEQAGDIEDLMRSIETSGMTFNLELAKHEYYQRAIEEWRKYKEAKRQTFKESRGI
jgi:hypothetical protein